jgi:tRNA nucleotidyltransferase (CCA-adding enzyme)
MTDAATDGLDAYVVGGAVRDELLGLPAGDRDWVVVGATPEEMARRGFIPVGGDFPVFLHPATKEEYALARTERKSGRGYKGFTFYTGPDVTLEADLERRDLTVNAIARRTDGSLVDPFGGVADLGARVLRHVGPAFAEDPVRILRLARFAARFTDFTVAPQTLALCRAMVDAGEADALVPERVWKELSRGLMAAAPSHMLRVLRGCAALPRVMPGLRVPEGTGAELDRAAAAQVSLPGRFALLCRQSDARERIAARLRVPTECADYARLLPEVLDALAAMSAPRPDMDGDLARLSLIERADGLRKPERFIDLLRTAQVAADVDMPAWQAAVDAVRRVDAGAIARENQGDAARIKPALRAARLRALAGLREAGGA